MVQQQVALLIPVNFIIVFSIRNWNRTQTTQGSRHKPERQLARFHSFATSVRQLYS